MLTRTIAVFLLSAAMAAAYSNGSRIPAGNSGEPGTGIPCASCHSVSLNPSTGSVKLTLPGANTFVPGVTQRWTVTVNDSNANYGKGFQLTATGTFAAVTSTLVLTSSGKQYVTQTGAASTYTFDWTAPADADTVTVYLAGAAASGTRATNVYTSVVTLQKATAKPVISSAGVVNAASFAAGITAGSWVAIFGNNLAPSGVARSWKAEEIVNGGLPLALEGTQVQINGKSAAISYVSESQLNVQAPDDASLGSVTVAVTTPGGTSDPMTADLRTAAPGLFRFTPNGSRYAAAVFPDGSYAGPPALFGTAITTRAAQPGETVLFFGTGFGATTPAVVAGQVFSGAAPLSAGHGLVIHIGGMQAGVSFAGLSAAGLYQFNVTVPALADGDQLVEASVWGVAVPTQQYLAVTR
jgi:uncharacterized protein (TIGR03437 family)